MTAIFYYNHLCRNCHFGIRQTVRSYLTDRPALAVSRALSIPPENSRRACVPGLELRVIIQVTLRSAAQKRFETPPQSASRPLHQPLVRRICIHFSRRLSWPSQAAAACRGGWQQFKEQRPQFGQQVSVGFWSDAFTRLTLVSIEAPHLSHQPQPLLTGTQSTGCFKSRPYRAPRHHDEGWHGCRVPLPIFAFVDDDGQPHS